VEELHLFRQGSFRLRADQNFLFQFAVRFFYLIISFLDGSPQEETRTQALLHGVAHVHAGQRKCRQDEGIAEHDICRDFCIHYRYCFIKDKGDQGQDRGAEKAQTEVEEDAEN